MVVKKEKKVSHFIIISGKKKHYIYMLHLEF